MTRSRSTASPSILGAPLALAAACGLAAPAVPAAGQLTEPFQAVFELESLAPWAGGDGSLGFIISEPYSDHLGRSVAPAGDVNGDGVDDLIIGSPGADAGGPEAGAAYIMFGRRGGGFGPEFDLSQLDGSNGFRIVGAERSHAAGSAVAGAGDVNGDGIGDVIVGSPDANVRAIRDAGQASVVFGRRGAFPAEIGLASLDGTNGFHVEGGSEYDLNGYAVAAAGDVNGDGRSDIIVGAKDGAIVGAYIIYGRSGAFPPSFHHTAVTGSAGFRVLSWSGRGYAGVALAGAGDVNGDGLDDIVIGAPDWYEDKYLPSRYFNDGDSYVIFGKEEQTAVDLYHLDGSDGFRMLGFGDLGVGYSVALADVNADGFADVVSGAPGSLGVYGEAHVIYGRASGFPAVLELASLSPVDGIRLLGAGQPAAGANVGSVRDVNGDGLPDVLVAGPARAHVVFGSQEPLPPVIELTSLDGQAGFTLVGTGDDIDNGQGVRSAGDINGDGVADLVLRGATHVRGGVLHNVVYVVYGRMPDSCYADCDGSGSLDVFDFLCFQNHFAAGDPRADCDQSASFDIYDFLCFQNAFLAGCP